MPGALAHKVKSLAEQSKALAGVLYGNKVITMRGAGGGPTTTRTIPLEQPTRSRPKHVLMLDIVRHHNNYSHMFNGRRLLGQLDRQSPYFATTPVFFSAAHPPINTCNITLDPEWMGTGPNSGVAGTLEKAKAAFRRHGRRPSRPRLPPLAAKRKLLADEHKTAGAGW